MVARRLTPVLAFVLLSSFGLAEIRYTVQPLPEANRIKVRMELDAKAGALELQMPNWAPGAYILTVPARNVQDLSIKGSDGAAIPHEKANDNTWKMNVAKSGGIVAEYTVPCQLAAGAMHFSGPAAYMYAVGRKTEPCKLTLDVPEGWKIAVGLDGMGKRYTAPDYDVLADNPVTMGDYIELTYTSLGKPHIISLRGAPRAQVDQKKIVEVCKHITEAQANFFGGLPYNKYVWHFNVTPGQDGGGGLEHLSSTQITLAQGIGPRSVRVLSHEFFHLWNVKRIRSKPLGPFDYNELPKTGALYWLEGTTDYYASLLLTRYGWFGEEVFYGDLVENTFSVRNNAARLEVSPYESSMRVGEANNGRGNSSGYRISYYNLGWLVGLVLDIELRARTNGRRSLDDVMRALWQLTKDDKPGFEEDEIRKQYVRFGGESVGAFFDRVVMQPGELPIEDQLAKVGLKLTQEAQKYVDPGFAVAPLFQSQLVRVSRVSEENSDIQVNDVVLEIDGKPITGATAQEALGRANSAIAALKAGSATKLKIRREGEEKELSVTPKEATRTRWAVVEDPSADAAKKELRKGWLFAGKK